MRLREVQLTLRGTPTGRALDQERLGRLPVGYSRRSVTPGRTNSLATGASSECAPLSSTGLAASAATSRDEAVGAKGAWATPVW